jgi:hypothetical protein
VKCTVTDAHGFEVDDQRRVRAKCAAENWNGPWQDRMERAILDMEEHEGWPAWNENRMIAEGRRP